MGRKKGIKFEKDYYAAAIKSLRFALLETRMHSRHDAAPLVRPPSVWE